MRKTAVVNNHTGIFFRSDSNGWNTNNEFVQRKNGTLALKNVRVHEGVNEFKIADANWSGDCNYGYDGSTPIMLSHNYKLTNGSNNNIRMFAHGEYMIDVYLYRDNDMTIRIVAHQ